MKLLPKMYVCLDGIYTDEDGIERRIVRTIDIKVVEDNHIITTDDRRYLKERIRDVYIQRNTVVYPGYKPLKLLKEKN